jgi:hypothetical protein
MISWEALFEFFNLIFTISYSVAMGQKYLLKWERSGDMKLRALIFPIRGSLLREASEEKYGKQQYFS